MEIKQQTVKAVFELDVYLAEDYTDKGNLKLQVEHKYSDFTEDIDRQELIEKLKRAKLEPGFYRLEIKVLDINNI